MERSIIFLSALLIFCTTLNAQENGKPNLSLEEHVFNFGNCNDGDKVEHTYKFKNVGSSPLEIIKVVGSCDCIDYSLPKNTFAPGEEGVLKVIFDSDGLGEPEGRPNSKRIVITANTDPANSYMYFNGNVISIDSKEEMSDLSKEQTFLDKGQKTATEKGGEILLLVNNESYTTIDSKLNDTLEFTVQNNSDSTICIPASRNLVYSNNYLDYGYYPEFFIVEYSNCDQDEFEDYELLKSKPLEDFVLIEPGESYSFSLNPYFFDTWECDYREDESIKLRIVFIPSPSGFSEYHKAKILRGFGEKEAENVILDKIPRDTIYSNYIDLLIKN